MNLSILNKPQADAVTAPLGPVLVLAGAGSGKTRVLTYRIAYLIEQGMFDPSQILAVTFTNKAAKEMQSRINVLLKGSAGSKLTSQPTLGTFHSIGARILRKHIGKLGYDPSFVILDTDDQLKILKDILKDLEVPKQYGAPLFRAYISGAKNLLQTPKQMEVGLDGYLSEIVQQVYVKYQDFLFKQNSLDFDDLLMLPILLFQSFPDVLRKFRELWQYILVDEYQDTNQAQYMFLHLLSAKGNLFVVGDDAQSIYGFRGSNIANILNFEKDFPNAQVIKLEQNYRSTKNILAAAQKVIELNKDQKPKTLWTDNPSGDKVIIEEVYDGHAEAVFVAKKIVKIASNDETEDELEYEAEPDFGEYSILDKFLAKQKNSSRFGSGQFRMGFVPQLPKTHGDLQQIAVLYRTHAQSRELEEVFIEAGIPYQIIGGVKYYERKEIKDVLAWLRLLVNPYDFVSLRRVVNLPPRGIGEKSLEVIRQFILSQEKPKDFQSAINSISQINLPPKQSAGLHSFYSVLHKARIIPQETTLSELLKVLVKMAGIEELFRDGTEQGEVRIENIRELFNVTSKFDQLAWQEGLQEFLEEVALITDLDKNSEPNSVTLMTLHAAKGLEFDTVFFVGLEEGILPHSNSLLDPSELAEEIRLAYVGLTRARKQLYLVYAKQRQMYGSFQANSPSRILHALPKEHVKLNGNLDRFTDSEENTYEPFE